MKRWVNASILALIPCSIFALFLPFANAEDQLQGGTIDISVPAVFTKGTDNKWRCYCNITIRNISEQNITLMWVGFNLVNITFVDETSEDLTALKGYNFTMDPSLLLKPGDKFSIDSTITDYGFEKEPTTIWIILSSSYLEFKTPLTVIIPIVPEFTSFLVLILLMIATSLETIAYARWLRRGNYLT
jgi:hypothetical protein